MDHFLLDQLPIVVLHHLLMYFLAKEILFSLLNTSPHLNHAIRSYSNYRLNFKSIDQSNFDLICRHILPNQVKVLILSDDQDTPGQSKLFLSHFQIDQFINLQSLTLIQMEKKSFEVIKTSLNKLDGLRSLLLNSEMTISLPLPLTNLRHLKLLRYSIDQLKNICLTTPRLKTLNVIVKHRVSNFEFQCQLDYLTRLVLKIDGKCFSVSIDEIKKILANFPRLKHLELCTKSHFDLVDGYEWELLAKDLITFKFIFNIELYSIEEILDTFRTSFWVKEKRWYVAYRNKYLYTIPCSMYTHVEDDFRPPKYTTALKNSIFYDQVIKLSLELDLIETGHRFINITTLEIGSEYISIEHFSVIVKLNGVKNLTLLSAMEKSEMKYLFNNMPCLQNLSIDTLMADEIQKDFQRNGRNFWDFLKKIKDLKFKQIRSLTISEYHIISDSYTINQLCRLFPSIERLHISIERVDNIIQLINNFECLSSASFILKLMSNNKWIIDHIQQSILSTFTYRFDDLCLHIWIKKEKEIIRKNNQLNKQEYLWSWFNYMLSQQSILSIIISFILIYLLIDISIYIWTYVFLDSFMIMNIVLHILQSCLIHHLIEFCSRFIKKYYRRFIYLFVYTFAWIFIAISYIFFDKWQLIFGNKINGDSLRLLFINPISFILTSLGCLPRLIDEVNMYFYYRWIICLILSSIIGLCICMIKLFVISFIL